MKQKFMRKSAELFLLVSMLEGMTCLKFKDPFAHVSIHPSWPSTSQTSTPPEPISGPVFATSAASLTRGVDKKFSGAEDRANRVELEELPEQEEDDTLHLFTQYILQDIRAKKDISLGFIAAREAHYGKRNYAEKFYSSSIASKIQVYVYLGIFPGVLT